MKIRNKKTGAEYSSKTLYVLKPCKINNAVSPVYYDKKHVGLLFPQRDGWETADASKMIWRKIERDENGFATDSCLDEMANNTLIAVHERFNEIDIIDGDYFEEWRGDIERHTYFTHWCKIEVPKFNIDGQ